MQSFSFCPYLCLDSFYILNSYSKGKVHIQKSLTLKPPPLEVVIRGIKVHIGSESRLFAVKSTSAETGMGVTSRP